MLSKRYKHEILPTQKHTLKITAKACIILLPCGIQRPMGETLALKSAYVTSCCLHQTNEMTGIVLTKLVEKSIFK